jgi:hypothetical protein
MISCMPAFGWAIVVLLVLTVLILAAVALQHRRRSGGVVSIGSKTSRRPRR